MAHQGSFTVCRSDNHCQECREFEFNWFPLQIDLYLCHPQTQRGRRQCGGTFDPFKIDHEDESHETSTEELLSAVLRPPETAAKSKGSQH